MGPGTENRLVQRPQVSRPRESAGRPNHPRDVYHMNPYRASQTPAHAATENSAHNGSIQRREAYRSNHRNLLGPFEALPSSAGRPEFWFRFASGNRQFADNDHSPLPQALPAPGFYGSRHDPEQAAVRSEEHTSELQSLRH